MSSVSSTVAGATELLEPTPGTRSFSAERLVRLGDVDPGGYLRLDATARLLQDVASDDASDAELDGAWGWIVRRTLIEVRQAAVLDERVELTTYCTGMGRSWAERTTRIRGDGGADIFTTSVWVQVSTESGRPSALTDQFIDTYGPACAGRKVSARLGLLAPTEAAERSPWTVRRADLDPFEHVNNAANWAFLEEALGPDASRVGRAEMEFAAPVVHGGAIEMAIESGDATAAWMVAEDRVLSAARWTPA
jgi:acyl-ACP thioesterase